MCHTYHHAHAVAYGFGHGCGCEPVAYPAAGCCAPAHGHHHWCCCCATDCCCGSSFRRRFVSREETISRLESYLADLQAEAKAVQEKIAALREAQ